MPLYIANANYQKISVTWHHSPGIVPRSQYLEDIGQAIEQAEMVDFG